MDKLKKKNRKKKRRKGGKKRPLLSKSQVQVHLHLHLPSFREPKKRGTFSLVQNFFSLFNLAGPINFRVVSSLLATLLLPFINTSFPHP